MVARVFAAIKNAVEPVITTVEVESDLITEMKTLKVDDFPLPNQFKTPNGWMEEDKTVAFWSMLSYPDIFSCLMFNLSELQSRS